MPETPAPHSSSAPNNDTDATQRVYIEPPRRTAPPTPSRPARAPDPRPDERQRRPARQKSSVSKREKATIIILLIIAAILLIAVIVTASIVFSGSFDDGRIQSNVFAAGVNLGGMTEEEARKALKQATDGTYSRLDMTVQVLDTTITLSPADTGASLDVDGVIQEALNLEKRSRVSELFAGNSPHTISVLEYLNLDTDYIRSVIDTLGEKYSSTLSQGQFRIEGDKPNMEQDVYDTSIPYQTLYIYVGTAEYGLSTDDLYQQVLDAYNINLFQVVGQCTVVAPDPLDLEAFHESIHTKPVDASINPDSFEVTPEIYGYGFDLEEAREKLSTAQYGETVSVSLHFLAPDITAEMLGGDLFTDILASLSTPVIAEDDQLTNLTANLNLACKAINGILLKPGEAFSFNEALGQPSVGKGYKKVETFRGKEFTEVLGGGISQVASTLYYCAMTADLDVISRAPHSYAPDYINVGMDAYVVWNSTDFSFRNTTDHPIRIEAQVSGGYVKIQLIGTDDRDYYVKMETEIIERLPTNLYLTMVENNPGKYQEGDILVKPIVGYDVITYRCLYEKETNRPLSKEVESQVRYDKRNQISIKIEIPQPEETIPPETDPVDPTDPTVPTNPTDPTDSTGSQPTEPSAPETPTENTQPGTEATGSTTG